MDHLIVLEAEQGRRCAKAYSPEGEHPYNAGTHFRIERRPVESIEDVARVLSEIEGDSRRMVIRGDVRDENAAKLIRFDDEGEHGPAWRNGFWRRKGPVFEDVDHRWMMIDVDTKSGGEKLLTDPEAAALAFIHAKLPTCFHDVSFYWHLSSGAGIKPGLRIHLWFWLTNAVGSEALREWAKGVPNIDPAVYKAVQPHYTANPLFKGVRNPVERRSGLFQGFDDAVTLTFDSVTSRTVTPATEEFSDDDFGGLLDAQKVGLTVDEAARYLQRLTEVNPDAVEDHDTWLKVGMALAHEFDKSDEAFALWEGWASASLKFDPKDSAYRWKSFSIKGDTGKVVTMGSVIKMAGGRLSDAGAIDEQISTAETLEQMIVVLRDAHFEAVALRDAAIGKAHKRLKEMRIAITLAEFKRAVRAARREKAQESGAMAAAWEPLFRDWCYVVADKEFINTRTGARMDKEGATDYWTRQMSEMGMVGEDFEEVKPVHTYMVEVGAKQVQAVEYLPGGEQFYMRGGVHYLNTWSDSRIEPDWSPAAIKAGKRFIEHVRRLVPNEVEAELTLDYIAALVLCPGRKFRWSLVLKGDYGNGKTAIADAVRAILGGKNVSSPENDQLEERFTDWLDGAQVVIIEELMGEDRQSLENKLKTFVGNDTVTIRPFGKKARKAPNRTNFLMFTNHDNAIKLAVTDRRYCVIQTSDALAMEDKAYFDALYDEGIRKYPGGILAALMEREENLDAFLAIASGRAPSTEAKAEMVYAGLCAEAQLIADKEGVFDDGLVTLKQAVIGLKELVGNINGRVTPKSAVRWLREAGWKRVTTFDNDRAGVVVKLGPGNTVRQQLWASHEKFGAASRASWVSVMEFLKEVSNEGFGEPSPLARRLVSGLSVVPAVAETDDYDDI